MIKDNQKYFNRLHLVLDGIVTGIAYVLAWYLRFESGMVAMEAGAGFYSMETYFTALYVIVPGYVFLYYVFHLYTPKRMAGRKREFYNIVKANSLGALLFIVTIYAVDRRDFSLSMILLFYTLNILLATLVRNLVHTFLRIMRKRGYNVKYILLVGYSRAAEEYINRIRSNPQWGYVVRGILDDKVPRGTMYRGVKVLGKINNLFVILPDSKLDEIAVTLALEDYDRLEEIVTLCEKSGVHTKFIPDYNSVIPSSPYMEDLQGLPVINIRHVPLTNTLNLIFKRIVDIVGSVFAIILVSPIMLITAVTIKLTSKGPVFFSQERVGLHNKSFKMYKFRSMREQAPESEKEKWTIRDDPRVTKVGKIIRRTSIDEFPQFWNVLKGDMSLVGPRPERPLFVEKFKEEIPRYMIKHQVRPGLTGWAQVNGYRGDTSIRKRIEYDLYYIENWTMGFDIKILFLTVFKGFVNKNAY
ncbi:MAG: undecaprenyl-phosphate glucose phosphotransferase [Lachnospiraceae bacterium]|nr:undecaprenyl-phosphate glucose phosphotransferase [Lachnospiraceae bacterium]